MGPWSHVSCGTSHRFLAQMVGQLSDSISCFRFGANQTRGNEVRCPAAYAICLFFCN